MIPIAESAGQASGGRSPGQLSVKQKSDRILRRLGRGRAGVGMAGVFRLDLAEGPVPMRHLRRFALVVAVAMMLAGTDVQAQGRMGGG